MGKKREGETRYSTQTNQPTPSLKWKEKMGKAALNRESEETGRKRYMLPASPPLFLSLAPILCIQNFPSFSLARAFLSFSSSSSPLSFELLLLFLLPRGPTNLAQLVEGDLGIYFSDSPLFPPPPRFPTAHVHVQSHVAFFHRTVRTWGEVVAFSGLRICSGKAVFRLFSSFLLLFFLLLSTPFVRKPQSVPGNDLVPILVVHIVMVIAEFHAR